MRLPEPAAALRHRGPALLLRRLDSYENGTLRCTVRGDRPSDWPTLLEAAAQAAGLVAGLQPEGLSNRAVIAEYRGVRLHALRHAGPVEVIARLDRRVLHFWRCRIEARDPAGALLLEGTVTLAPGE